MTYSYVSFHGKGTYWKGGHIGAQISQENAQRAHKRSVRPIFRTEKGLGNCGKVWGDEEDAVSHTEAKKVAVCGGLETSSLQYHSYDQNITSKANDEYHQGQPHGHDRIFQWGPRPSVQSDIFGALVHPHLSWGRIFFFWYSRDVWQWTKFSIISPITDQWLICR